MRIEHLYGHDNELLTERYTIVRVNEVLVDLYWQGSLFQGEKNRSHPNCFSKESIRETADRQRPR